MPFWTRWALTMIRELAAWRPQSARAALEQCLRVWHGIPQVHLLAAQAAWQMQDFDAARAQLHHAQRRRGQADDDTAFAWALLEAAAGNVLETEDYLQQQASRRPADAPLIWEALALGYLRTYRTLDAMTVCNHWLEQYPDHVRALELRGRTFITGQGVSRGAQDYRRALELDPNRDDTRWRLVEALITLSAYAEAAEHLERAIELQPGMVEAYTQLGEIYEKQERYDEALQVYEQASLIAPHDPAHHSRVGRLYRRIGHLEEAVARFEKMAEMYPESAVAYDELGRCLSALGRHEEALQAYLEAIRREPETAEYCYNAGTAYKELKRYAEGAAMFRKAVQLQPDHTSAYKQWAALSAVSFLRQPRRNT